MVLGRVDLGMLGEMGCCGHEQAKLQEQLSHLQVGAFVVRLHFRSESAFAEATHYLHVR